MESNLQLQSIFIKYIQLSVITAVVNSMALYLMNSRTNENKYIKLFLMWTFMLSLYFQLKRNLSFLSIIPIVVVQLIDRSRKH